jgi:uncharacterized protein involved in exopolysaccharide biosynthesis
VVSETVVPVWTGGTRSDVVFIFLRRARRDWLLAIGIVLAGVVMASVLAFALPSYWRVQITMIPASKSGSGLPSVGGFDLSAVSGLLDGAGALLGRPSANEDEALAVLGSRELFDTYATRENLLPVLYASKWDAESKSWNVTGSDVPTLRRAYELLNDSIREINLDRRSGIVTMSITWKDPVLAVKWARDLVALTNEQLRQRAIEQAKQNMSYLAAAMRDAQSQDGTNALAAAIRDAQSQNGANILNSALASAYEHALQSYVFANGQAEYGFRIIDPPTVPDPRERVWPQRILLIALGFILGCVLAAAVILFRTRGERDRAAP